MLLDVDVVDVVIDRGRVVGPGMSPAGTQIVVNSSIVTTTVLTTVKYSISRFCNGAAVVMARRKERAIVLKDFMANRERGRGCCQFYVEVETRRSSEYGFDCWFITEGIKRFTVVSVLNMNGFLANSQSKRQDL